MKTTIVVLLTLLAQPVFSATINVPANQPTIQAGLDAASAGDTVLVAAGTYTGDGNRDISFGGKAVSLRSAEGPTMTIIDCEGSDLDYHQGFLIENSEGPGTIISGFTIRNAYARSVGGAMSIVAAGPTIENCIFDSNYAGGAGGALWVDNGSAANIRECLFINNESGMQGGAMLLRDSNPIITSCTFYQNGSAEGSAFYSQNSLPVISFTLITHSLLPGEAWARSAGGSNTPSFECCNIWGNPGGDWPVNVYPPYVGLDGNISEDPLYCAENPTVFPDDLYIAGESPCAPDNNECGKLLGRYPVGCQATGVDDDYLNQLPAGYRLAQNYPNPFNPVTRIDFELPRATQVKLTVFNLIGGKVAVLVDERLSAGTYSETWDGSEAASGIYLYRLEVGETSVSRKMVLLK